MRLPTTVRSFWPKSQSWSAFESSPVVKSTAIIPISDRGQGWQWKSIYNLIARSSSFYHALTSQLLECGWSKAEESSSFCCPLTSQLLEWLEQGSASFVAEGCCFWNQTLRGFSGSQTVFQVSSPQEATAFLTLAWWIRGMTPVTLIAVGVARTTMWGLSKLAEVVPFSSLLPIPHLLADRDGPNCPKEWVSCLRFLGWYGGRLFPGPGGVGTSPGQLVFGGLPWVFLSLGVFSHIRSQRESSLRTSGYIGLGVRLGGNMSSQDNRVSCQSLDNVVLRVWFMCSTFPELCGL